MSLSNFSKVTPLSSQTKQNKKVESLFSTRCVGVFIYNGNTTLISIVVFNGDSENVVLSLLYESTSSKSFFYFLFLFITRLTSSYTCRKPFFTVLFPSSKIQLRHPREPSTSSPIRLRSLHVVCSLFLLSLPTRTHLFVCLVCSQFCRNRL